MTILSDASQIFRELTLENVNTPKEIIDWGNMMVSYALNFLYAEEPLALQFSVENAHDKVTVTAAYTNEGQVKHTRVAFRIIAAFTDCPDFEVVHENTEGVERPTHLAAKLAVSLGRSLFGDVHDVVWFKEGDATCFNYVESGFKVKVII